MTQKVDVKMKKAVLFTSLAVVASCFSFALVSCTDDDDDDRHYNKFKYSELPTKYASVKTWFANNPTIAPTPMATTMVEAIEGKKIEDDHAIGTYYYEVDIDDYSNAGKKYDVEFYLDVDAQVFAVVVNDVKHDETTQSYAVAETQLKKDYGENVTDIRWVTQRGYQVGTFFLTTNSAKARSLPQTTITAWYTVTGESATREMDSEDLGTTVPAKIKAAFEATEYSNTALWRIDEIEIEHTYNNNSMQSYYEMELESVGQLQTLEAELFFSYETGELLYSKEELDDGDDAYDDIFVVNAQLKAAVEKAVPGAQIIDAEVEDNVIEVEAIITVDGIKKEIELEFSMDYVLISEEIETEYLYSQLPAKFDGVKTWFASNPTIPAPPANTEVEITEGEQVEDDHVIGTYFYEIDIDDYMAGTVEYEVEFYLDADLNIIAVIVNDVKN